MNSGDLNEKIKILTLSKVDDIYQWIDTASIWAKAEMYFNMKPEIKKRQQIKPVKFIIRKHEISLENAILWNNEYCFITNIIDIDRLYQEVTAVVLEPKVCTVAKTTVILGALNRPVVSESSNLTFPGCMISLSSKRSEAKPMSFYDQRYLLIIPKSIDLMTGEIVTIEGVDFEVWVPHSFSDPQNQYEVRVRRDI
jgi:hypothetical protein